MKAKYRANFLDGEVLKKRQENLKKKHTLLKDGVYVQGKIIRFVRRDIDGLFSVMLPTDFEVMPEELAEVKYPSAFRPQAIYTNMDLSVNLGFSAFLNHLESRETQQIADRIMQTLDTEGSGLDFDVCTSLENVKGHWFAFRTHVMDSEAYNMMLIAMVGQRILQTTFNCPLQDYPDWKPAVLQMWESIKS